MTAGTDFFANRLLLAAPVAGRLAGSLGIAHRTIAADSPSQGEFGIAEAAALATGMTVRAEYRGFASADHASANGWRMRARTADPPRFRAS